MTKDIQGAFSFREPTAPFNGRGWLSTECSKAGADHATERLARQALELLTLYRAHGPLTDAEAADLTGWERSTVIPRRREMQLRGLVVAVGKRLNAKSGLANTTWGLIVDHAR